MSGEEISQINVAAYYLAQKGYTFDKLCWELARRQLILQRDPRHDKEVRIKEKAAELFFSGASYDILCYLISEIDIKAKS